MNRVFTDMGPTAACSVDGVVARMQELGASADECRVLVEAEEAFGRWCRRRGLAGGRDAGMEWLRAVRDKLPSERYGAVKAGLTTWFHLTGGARRAEERVRDLEGGLSTGGRVSGEAGSWQEAGERFKGFMGCRSYSRNTVECYIGWARRFCRWCLRAGKEAPAVGTEEIRGFLEWLAGTQVVAKTQNQALNAIVGFFRHGLGKEPGEIGEYLRAKVSKRLPVVLDRKEAAAVMSDLEGRNRAMWLMAGVMLGAGLRQREVLELRVKDLDLERGAITVRQGKGNKDRVTMLPERIRDGLAA